MVIVSNYFEVETKDGKKFISLELTGSLELIQSQTSGNFYATVRKCRVSSTFDSNVAKMMIGTRMDGDIVRVETEPYQFLNKTTGEIMTLNHSYAYRPKGSMELLGESRVQEIQMA